MYAHQAGVMEEGEQTWHPDQLGVSEVRERGTCEGTEIVVVVVFKCFHIICLNLKH